MKSFLLKHHLAAALAVSLALHAFALFGIVFVLPDPRNLANTLQPLQVVLVNSSSRSRPEKPDAYAQHNLDGGGNTEEDRQAKSPLPNLNEGKQFTPEQTAMRVQLLEQESKRLMTQLKSMRAVAREKQAKQQDNGSTGSDLAQRSLEMARLDAQINKEYDAYQKMPRRRVIGARTQEYRFAQYVEDWRLKVERIGNLNYPQAARQKRIFGSLILTVNIRADGSVASVEVKPLFRHKRCSMRRRCASSSWARPTPRSRPTSAATPTYSASPAPGHLPKTTSWRANNRPGIHTMPPSPFMPQKRHWYSGFLPHKSSTASQEGVETARLADEQRRISMYLRALWAHDFSLCPASSASSGTRIGHRPFVQDNRIYLPDTFARQAGTSGAEFYRATATHCALHLVYMQAPLLAKNLKPLQIALIGLIEDARVETLAIRRFPGLKNLWLQFHAATPVQSATAGDYLDRLARALLDEDYADHDPWIALGRKLFSEAQVGLDSNRVSWDIGLTLAQAFAEKRVKFSPRHAIQAAYYRDDNYCLWEFRETKSKWRLAVSLDTPDQVIKADKEMSGEVVQQVLDYTIAPDPNLDVGDTGNLARKATHVRPFHYPEWDYQSRAERPAWSTVFEKPAEHGDPAAIDDIAQKHRHIIRQMRYLLDAMHPQGVMRLRRLEEGDEIDLNPAIDSLIDMQAGREPSSRIMMRNSRKNRDIAVMTLLDLSQSTNNLVAGHGHTVLDLTRQATVLLAEAIQRVGDPFAIHGFCSNGRHDVAYYRFKDFGQAYDTTAKARLAGMDGQLSTRMGAAIRHATRHLKQQRSIKKLLLVITDGEPADIDVYDPKYLRFDTKKAVDEARSFGIIPYCISLDPCADEYVSRIFGLRNYMVVDHVGRLPDRLPLLYAAITR